MISNQISLIKLALEFTLKTLKQFSKKLPVCVCACVILNILTWNGCRESEQIPDFSFTIENSTFSISQI